MDIDNDIKTTQRTAFKAFMLKQKLNASSWAKKSGVTESTIRHYLSGRNQSLTSLILEKLARSVNASISDLIAPNNFKTENESPSNFDREIMIKVIGDAEIYLAKHNVKASSENKAMIFMSWYDLSMLLKKNNLTVDEDLIKEIINRETG